MNFIKLITSSFTIYAVVLIIEFNFASCNYFAEPEAYENKKISAPENRELIIPNIQPGDTITDRISFEFKPDLELSEIDYIVVLNDSIEFPKHFNAPFNLDIDIRWWLNGNGNLSVGLYKKNYNIGSLKLRKEPSIKYTIPLLFQHAPLLTGLKGRRKELPGGAHSAGYLATIVWEPRLIEDIKYYIINFHKGSVSKISDTIYNPYQNTYSKTITSEYNYFSFEVGNQYGITNSGILYLTTTN